MKTKQIYNLIKIALFCCILLCFNEFFFSLEFVNTFVENLFSSTTNVVVLLVLVWLIMFLQVWLIPIPAITIIQIASHTSLISNGLFNFHSNDLIFIAITLSAYFFGFIIAYFIGYKFGKKALVWAAGNEEDYQKWQKFITTKGKWWYALTVLLPCFPDDFLCFVAGSVKLNFAFFTITNLICRLIGIIASIQTLNLIESASSSSPSIGFFIYLLISIVLFILLFVFKNKLKKENSTL